MRTQVAIIGSGPAGLLLGQLLTRAGISNVILERRDKARVLARVRAGVLEQGTATLLRAAGIGARMDREGLRHTGVEIAHGDRHVRIDLTSAHPEGVIVYGQTEVTLDLMNAREADGAMTVYAAEDVTINGADTDAPRLSFAVDGEQQVLECDFIAGCDGYHGVSRRSIPASLLRTFEKQFPFGWLGILAATPPVSDELIYINHEDGFALCSMRSPSISRCYVQCEVDDDVANWPARAFWEELARRLPADRAAVLQQADPLEQSIALVRAFVAEPLSYGRLFLAGDAAHIVPPTGAKGLNLAAGDVGMLAAALGAWYQGGDAALLQAYSADCLRRIWRAVRFSVGLTRLLHRFPEHDELERRLQRAELDQLMTSKQAQAAFAESYVAA